MFALTILCATAAVLAQQPASTQQTTQAASSKPHDFSKGYEQFYKLGLPVVGKATYVKLNARRTNPKSKISTSEILTCELQLAGNAWMLKEDKNGTSLFVISPCRTLEVYDRKTLIDEQQKKMMAGNKSGSTNIAFFQFGEDDAMISGTWTPVDPRQDVNKIIAFLNKQGRSKSYILETSNGYGQLLFYAINFHSADLTNEANIIAGMVFDAAGDNSKVILQCLALLVNSQYNVAHERFLQTGNWGEFHQTLTTLLARHSTGWHKAPAVRLLANQVNDRVTHPDPPDVTGEAITDQDKALARALANEWLLAWELQKREGYGVWVLPSTSDRHPGMPIPGNVLFRITQQGLASLPLLMALIKDESLTRIDKLPESGMDYAFYSLPSKEDYSSSVRAEEDQKYIRKTYNNLSRPLTRGEIAFHYLKTILPPADGESNRYKGITMEDILERMPEWIKANKDKTQGELARVYLKEGNDTQRKAAIEFLTNSKSDEDAAAVEKYIMDLGEDDDEDPSWIAAKYVAERGIKARPFAEKFQARLIAQLKEIQQAQGENSSAAKKTASRKKKIDQSLQTIQENLSTQSARELLADIARNERDISSSYSLLMARMNQEKPGDGLTMLLESAIAATNGNIAESIIQLTSSMRNKQMNSEMFNEDSEMRFLPDADMGYYPDNQTHAELWKRLLTDTRPVELDTDAVSRSICTVGDAAADAIEALYGEKRNWLTNYKIKLIAPQRTQTITRFRAEARLAGKEIPEYPEFEELSKTQRAQLVETIAKTPDSELDTRLDTLSLNDYHALAKEVITNSTLAARLVSRAHTIKTVITDGVAPDWQKELERLRGKILKKDMLEQALANCKEILSQNCVVEFAVIRLSCLDGINIKVTVTPTNSPLFSTRIKKGSIPFRNDTSHIIGVCRASSSFDVAFWPAEMPESTVLGKASLTDQEKRMEKTVQRLKTDSDSNMKQNQADFWKAIDCLLQSKDNVCTSAMIRFGALPVLYPAPGPRVNTLNE